MSDMSDSIQEVVQNMLNSVLPVINTPGTSYYLPTWVQTNGYDPYGKADGITWSVTLTDQTVIKTAASICAQLWQNGGVCKDENAFYIAAPGNPPVLVAGGKNPGDLLISGFANAVMASMTSQEGDPYTIVAVARFNTLPNYAPNAVISGKFTFTEYCCCSLDQKVCTTAPEAAVGSGVFTATIDGSATATITFGIIDLDPGVLTIGVDSVNLVMPTKNGNPAITIKIDITSIPKGVNSKTYNDAAMEAFNSPQGLSNIAAQMNHIMNQPVQLETMGEILTGVIDGYLKNSHQYPFNAASLALY